MTIAPTAPTVRAIADRLLVDLAPADPVAARAAVTAGLRTDIPLLSASDPGSVDDRLAAHRRVLDALQDAVPTGAADLDLAAALADRAHSEIALHAVGFGAEQLAPLACVPQRSRSEVGQAVEAAVAAGAVLDGTGSAEAWDRAIASMQQLPEALRGHRQTLERAVAEGRVPARRQVLVVAGQCADWIDPTGSDWFRGQLTRAPSDRQEQFSAAIESAVRGVAAYRSFLLELAPSARTTDAVGLQTYTVTAGAYLGDAVDPLELAAWGEQELHRITAEIDDLARTIHPDGPAAAAALLDADPARRLHSAAQIEGWLEQTLDRTADVIGGRYVTLPTRHPLPRCRVSDSGAGVMYYEPAEVDGTVPGTIWWAQEPGAPVHTWREHSTAHHEGVPGHHLQITLAAENPDLHAWQRFCCHVHGHAEGWAHHSESWAGEIGLLEDPGNRLGMLLAQAWRAARIVIDTGLHLGLRPPPGAVDGDPRVWTIPAAEQYLRRISGLGAVAAHFEVERYLGWPGQALAFRVGARLFDEILAGARRRSDFDERDFRTSLLRRGPMGLGPLRQRVLSPTS